MVYTYRFDAATHATRALQVAFVCAVILGCLLVFAPRAHALAITEVKYTGPVAYELKSLQTTRFYCTVDTPGVWATLRIKDGQGKVVRTIYNGPIQDAGTRFYFPLWNGLDDAGNRLFSASWNWELTIAKGGQSATQTGKITVSKIEFFMTGRVQDMDEDLHSKYMIPGNANLYIRLTSRAWVDVFGLELYDPVGTYWSGLYSCDDTAVLNITTYLRGSDAIDRRGMHDFYLSGANDVTYYVTVIQ